MIKKVSLALAIAALAALGLAACGGSSSSSTTTPASTTAPAGGSSGGSSGSASTVNISADPSGQLAYQQKSVTAKAGDVSVDFTNMSSTTHDVCIQSSSGQQLGCTDQIAGSTASHDFGNLKPGSYTFYCSVDGHEAAGMKGTMTVK